MNYSKTCARCGSDFTGTGPAAKYCPECMKLRVRKKVAAGVYSVPDSARFIAYKAMVRHNKELHSLGVFSTVEDASNAVAEFRSNNKKVSQGKWSKDNRTTTKIGWFMANRGRIKEERRFCNRCGKDLKDVGRYSWCVHHIDHDRTNNTEDNLELLCKRCHQNHHTTRNPDTGVYVETSTTISKESTPQANGGGSGEQSND